MFSSLLVVIIVVLGMSVIGLCGVSEKTFREYDSLLDLKDRGRKG